MFARIFLISALSFITTLPVIARESGDTPQAYRDAYFAETHDGDIATAIKLYQKAIDSGKGASEIIADAKTRLAICREALASRDLAALAPKETVLFAQIANPGAHFGRLLDHLGLVGEPLANIGADAIAIPDGEGAVLPKNVCLSRMVVKEIGRFAGAAVAITDIDFENEAPRGVLIIDPGKADLLRGWLETVAQFGKPGDPIGGHPTIQIDDSDLSATITFTARLIIAGTSRDLVAGVVNRLGGEGGESLVDAPAFASQTARRDNAVLHAFINGKQALKLAYRMAQHEKGMMQELGMAQAFFDLQHLESISFSAGTLDDGLAAELVMNMSEGQTNMIYNLMRTPPITGEALSMTPASAAAVLSFGLNPQSTEAGRQDVITKAQTAQAITGLDFAREVFANIREVALFVTTPGAKRSRLAVPDVGMVMTVANADKSEALWDFLLSLPARFMGGQLQAPATTDIKGVTVHTYQLPEQMQVMMARHKDVVIVSLTPGAMQKAISVIDSGDNVLSDPRMKAAVDRVGKDTSVAFLAHVGRIVEVAAAMADEDEAPLIRLVGQALHDTMLTELIDESETRCGIKVQISGLPKASKVIEILQQSGALGAVSPKQRDLMKANEAHETALVKSEP